MATVIYARTNLEMKRKALEKVAIVPDANDVPFWTEDKNYCPGLKDTANLCNYYVE